MDKEFEIGEGPKKGKKVVMHIPTGNNTIKLILAVANDILHGIISPIAKIQGAWADPYIACLADYDFDNEDKRKKILDQMAEKYNINRAILEGYQDSPLVVFALLALEQQDKDHPMLIGDGYGNTWNVRCPECNQDTMEVVRPGKVQCGNCE